MAQEHQEGNYVDPANQSVRRKRGRPRKDDVSGSEPYRSRRRKGETVIHETDPFVGQVVSGVLDGKFDAGYMLTVRIGERGSVLRGVVFEPGLSVPISPANDIAPNVKMFERDEVPLPPAQQVPYFTPIRSRKDGALRYRQRNESLQEISPNTVAEDLNVNVQMDSPVNIQKLPENDSNHVSGSFSQYLKPTTEVRASKDGTCDVQSTNAVAECSGDIHVPETGNTSGIASDTATAIHTQEHICEDNPITEQPETVSQFKKATTPDSKADLTSHNLTSNLQEVVGDVKLDTQIPEVSCEAKQTVETSDAVAVSISDNKIASLHEANDGESQTKTFVPKEGAETADSASVSKDGADAVAVSICDNKIASLHEANDGESQTKTFAPKEGAETADPAPVSKDGASDECDGVVLPPVTVPASEQSIGVNESIPVTNVSETKTSEANQPSEVSDSGRILTNGAPDDYVKDGASDGCDGVVLPPVTVPASEQNIGVNESIPVANVTNTKTSEANQPSEESDSGRILTNGAPDDYVKVPLPEHMSDTADHSLVVPPPGSRLSVSESAPQHSVKLDFGDETAGVADMNSSVGQEYIAQ